MAREINTNIGVVNIFSASVLALLNFRMAKLIKDTQKIMTGATTNSSSTNGIIMEDPMNKIPRLRARMLEEARSLSSFIIHEIPIKIKGRTKIRSNPISRSDQPPISNDAAITKIKQKLNPQLLMIDQIRLRFESVILLIINCP
jgi:hypothetical protein